MFDALGLKLGSVYLVGDQKRIEAKIETMSGKDGCAIVLLRFIGKTDADVIAKWSQECAAGIFKHLAGKPFHVVADLRQTHVIHESAVPLMAEGQKAFAKAGMRRSFVVASQSTALSNFRRIADQSGIAANERGVYMSMENQEKVGAKVDEILKSAALRWLQDGVFDLKMPFEIK